MKKVQRFDSVQVKAKIDEHGFLVDRPIVARIGLQVYRMQKRLLLVRALALACQTGSALRFR